MLTFYIIAAIVVILMIVNWNESIIILVYCKPINKYTKKIYLHLLSTDSFTVRAGITCLVLSHKSNYNLNFISSPLRSLYFSYYISGIGTVYRWSKLHFAIKRYIKTHK